ncbi:type I methionyl aminopeptidase [Anaeromyxobacter sp. Fw109-5]|uniref:type I methionyl aminopeptidase n=1 Tax=Anaeromyxobacter sp. (strain Fw109-5) TaxID=404589 RepID=UPI0000ED74A9|nr:type I methionyl aminopeptidase [Anaeromyxobacter sp. Fw109-5]ABS26626.1 methionine aminopeptidase, type I [Anaeromyxobacter sp. Fw109-5]
MNETELLARARPGRNDPCWCGSGQKYKKCHLDEDARASPAAPARSVRARLRPGVVSPRRPVPAAISRPDYASNGRPRAQGRDVKTAEELERLRRACRAAARVLRVSGEAVRPGITTDALDEIAHAETIRLGGYPSPLNYRGFPKSLCTSVNEVICHGIPDSRPLEAGDIVNLDVTVYLDGMHGDCSATFLVGEVDPEGRRLVQVARECLAKGVAAVLPGRPISDIGRAIEAHASRHGYGVVRSYCGHGIGETFHTSLQIPHHYDPSVRRLMEEGMTFTIEPMITEGTWQDLLWDDGWTAVTADGKRSAQFEHTIAVTGGGAEILTSEG